MLVILMIILAITIQIMIVIIIDNYSNPILNIIFNTETDRLSDSDLCLYNLDSDTCQYYKLFIVYIVGWAITIKAECLTIMIY